MLTEFAQETLTAAVCAAARLVGQMNQLAQGKQAAAEADFDQLVESVAALGPGVLGSRFRENLERWPGMWLEGDFLAARYQLVQLVRRLKTVRDALAEADSAAELVELDESWGAATEELSFAGA